MTAQRVANPDRVGDGDPSEGAWSQLEVLLASLLDETRFLRWETAVSRLEKGSRRPPPPEPTPRPGVGARAPKKALPPHVAEFLFQHMNGGADEAPRVTAGVGGLNGLDQRR